MGSLAFLLSFIGVATMQGISAQQQTHTQLLPIMLQQIAQNENKQVILQTPPRQYTLPDFLYVAQTFNNCGPASLAMVLGILGKSVSQEELASKLRPFNNPLGGIDDKSVSPEELISGAQSYGFEAIHRPNGTTAKLAELTANNVPVIIRSWLATDDPIGHYRIIKGYDKDTRVFTVEDSYLGQNLTYSYDDLETIWKPFNYSYIIVYPKEKQAIVDAILGEDSNEKVAWKNALGRANEALQTNPDDTFALFNQSTAYYHLGNYDKAISYYEKVESKLPSDTLWYQLEPILAYEKTNNSDRVFALTDAILNNGNLADSELYQLRGEIYLEKGDLEAAKDAFGKAVYYNQNYKPHKKH